MTRKVVFGLALAVALALLGAWRLGWIFKPALYVGLVVPLTGPDVAEGAGLRNGAQLAFDEANARGGVEGRRIKVLLVDDFAEQERAIAAAKAFVADKRVVAVTGYFNPVGFWGAHDSYELAKLALVVSGVRARETPHLFGSGDNEFSLVPLGPAITMPAARWAWDVVGARKHVYVREKGFDGQSEVNRFRSALSTVVGKVVTGDEQVEPDATDFAALVQKIKADGNDLVFYGGRARQAGLFARQLRAAGVTAPLVVGMQEPSDQFLDAAKEAAEGAVTAFPARPLEDSKAGREFLERYRAHGFAEPPGHWGLYGYAAAQIIVAAMEKSFLTRASVAGALRNELHASVLGPVKYFVGGSTFATPVLLYQVKSGRWTPVYQSDKAGKLEPYTPAP